MWRVLIVEDDAPMRDFFAQSVSRSPELALIGAVGSVTQACALLDEEVLSIDVVLTDLGLPDGSGLEVIRHARRRNALCEPLVISMFGDDENVLASIEAGALGYIHKDATPDDIAQTILEMKAGASPISPMIARRVLAKYRGPAKRTGNTMPAELTPEPEPTPVPAAAESPNRLSPREFEVLELIARGFTYAEISRLQGISVHTVQTHIKSLYRKLAVNSKSEAVYEATKLGLLQLHG